MFESSDMLDMFFLRENGHNKCIFIDVKVSIINICLTEVSSNGFYSSEINVYL